MLIVIEGADGVGKTTLCRTLASHATDQGWPVTQLHAGPPVPGTLLIDQYERPLVALREACLSATEVVILDRWHLGEQVYGPMLRGKNQLTDAQFDHCELLLEALGAIKIVVTASRMTITERLAVRGDPIVTTGQSLFANVMFNDLSHRVPGWRTLQSPPGAIDDEGWATALLSDLMVSQLGVRALIGHPGYVGPVMPRLLLVGDVPGGRWSDSDGIQPAFYPVIPNSASYLLNALRVAGATMSMIGMCNANDGTDLVELHRLLGYPRTVALGRRAAATMRALDIHHVERRHPQYVRRFNHANLYTYGSGIWHVATDPEPDPTIEPEITIG